MSKPRVYTVTIDVDKRKALKDALDRMRKTAVYVGIPADSEQDKRPDKAPITNAQLGYIHEYGSPSANIPARPFLRPGIQKAEGSLRKTMKRAATAVLAENEAGFQREMETVALKAETAVKDYMNSGEFEPLAPSTIKKRKSKIEKLGSEDMTIKPLIDTGNLQNSIAGLVVEE